MIRFENVSLSYGDRTVLSGVTLHIPPGGSAALMGPSGCGKTSMLDLAAGLLAPASGAVKCAALRLAYAFQEPRLLPRLTAVQNVNAVLSDGPATLPQAMAWLEAVGLADAADKLPHQLSGGMAQRVNLARALAFEGDLLLLDEPLRELDEARQESVLALLKEQAAGRTVLVTTHDPAVASALADAVYTFRDGAFVPAGQTK